MHRNTLKNVSSNAGFTLLEVIVALTIFAVGMLGIAGVQLNAFDFNSNSNARTVAATLAQGAMERILSTDSSNANFKSTSVDKSCADDVCYLDPDNHTATTLDISGSGTYSATWSVTPNTPVTDIATISVTVTGSAGKTVTLTNYKRTL